MDTIWKMIHTLNPLAIPSLLSPLLRGGTHPHSRKVAYGIAFPELDKLSYIDLGSFVVIVLPIISKILERFIALCLFDHASTANLIH